MLARDILSLPWILQDAKGTLIPVFASAMVAVTGCAFTHTGDKRKTMNIIFFRETVFWYKNMNIKIEKMKPLGGNLACIVL